MAPRFSETPAAVGPCKPATPGALLLHDASPKAAASTGIKAAATGRKDPGQRPGVWSLHAAPKSSTCKCGCSRHCLSFILFLGWKSNKIVRNSQFSGTAPSRVFHLLGYQYPLQIGTKSELHLPRDVIDHPAVPAATLSILRNLQAPGEPCTDGESSLATALWSAASPRTDVSFPSWVTGCSQPAHPGVSAPGQLPQLQELPAHRSPARPWG